MLLCKCLGGVYMKKAIVILAIMACVWVGYQAYGHLESELAMASAAPSARWCTVLDEVSNRLTLAKTALGMFRKWLPERTSTIYAVETSIAKTMSSQTPDRTSAALVELEASLSRLISEGMNSVWLMFSQRFTNVARDLDANKGRVLIEITRYNEAAYRFHMKASQFPFSLVASLSGTRDSWPSIQLPY